MNFLCKAVLLRYGVRALFSGITNIEVSIKLRSVVTSLIAQHKRYTSLPQNIVWKWFAVVVIRNKFNKDMSFVSHVKLTKSKCSCWIKSLFQKMLYIFVTMVQLQDWKAWEVYLCLVTEWKTMATIVIVRVGLLVWKGTQDST